MVIGQVFYRFSIHFEAIFFGFQARTAIPHLNIDYDKTRIAAFSSQSAIQSNKWTHLAITFDQNFNYRFYINSNLTSNIS